MEQEKLVLCQSCAMPMVKEEDFGTNADGSRNRDYCVYCFKGGKFPCESTTMEEMIEFCVPLVSNGNPYNSADEARDAMLALFPQLKRWRMKTLEKISHDTMVFMRTKYRLDEVGDGKDELKFKQGKRTIVTVYTRDDKYAFLIIFGKKEREAFEASADTFSQYIRRYYENSKTYHDGKWMLIEVTTLEQLEEIKRLIMIKKKPNRKPFGQDGAVYSKCGHRCDLCIHYTELSEEQRHIYNTHVRNVWYAGRENPDGDMRCGGCKSENCYCRDEPCSQMKCAEGKGLSACTDCSEYPCLSATVGDCCQKIHTECYTADDITYGVLPYIPYQFEKEYD